MIFGANNFPAIIPFDPTKDGWICWDKRCSESADRMMGSPFELALVRGKRTYKMIRIQHGGVVHADSGGRSVFTPQRNLLNSCPVFSPSSLTCPCSIRLRALAARCSLSKPKGAKQSVSNSRKSTAILLPAAACSCLLALASKFEFGQTHSLAISLDNP